MKIFLPTIVLLCTACAHWEGPVDRVYVDERKQVDKQSQRTLVSVEMMKLEGSRLHLRAVEGAANVTETVITYEETQHHAWASVSPSACNHIILWTVGWIAGGPLVWYPIKSANAGDVARRYASVVHLYAHESGRFAKIIVAVLVAGSFAAWECRGECERKVLRTFEGRRWVKSHGWTAVPNPAKGVTLIVECGSYPSIINRELRVVLNDAGEGDVDIAPIVLAQIPYSTFEKPSLNFRLQNDEPVAGEVEINRGTLLDVCRAAGVDWTPRDQLPEKRIRVKATVTPRREGSEKRFLKVGLENLSTEADAYQLYLTIVLPGERYRAMFVPVGKLAAGKSVEREVELPPGDRAHPDFQFYEVYISGGGLDVRIEPESYFKLPLEKWESDASRDR